jgi:hypothetical protein
VGQLPVRRAPAPAELETEQEGGEAPRRQARLGIGRRWHRDRRKPAPAGDAIALYLEWLPTERRSPKTLAKYKAVLDRVGALPAARRATSLLDLDLQAVDAYRRARVAAGVAAKTLYTETVIVRQLVNFALSRRLIADDPLRGLRIRRVVEVGATSACPGLGRDQRPAYRPPLCHDDDIRAVALSRDGNVAMTGSGDRTARLWDARTGKSRCGPLQHQGQVAVALNAEGTLALTGSDDRTARVWRVPGGEAVGDPLHHPGQVLAVAFRPDSRAVLTGCEDGVARLWTLAPAEPDGTPVPGGDLKALPHLAHSPDGRTMLLGRADGTAQVLDADTMQPVGPPLRHEYAVLSVAVSPDGTRLLTGCVDGTAHIWSERTRRPIGRPLLQRGPVHSVAFSPDGGTVLTGGGDRTARLWDAATGKPIGMPLAHDGVVVAVAFEAGGDAVLTKTEDGVVRRWELAAEAPGPDERFVLWAQVAIGAEIDAGGTVRGLDSAAWDEKRDRLRALGGAPRP